MSVHSPSGGAILLSEEQAQQIAAAAITAIKYTNTGGNMTGLAGQMALGRSFTALKRLREQIEAIVGEIEEYT